MTPQVTKQEHADCSFRLLFVTEKERQAYRRFPPKIQPLLKSELSQLDCFVAIATRSKA